MGFMEKRLFELFKLGFIGQDKILVGEGVKVGELKVEGIGKKFYLIVYIL